jgi:uncharacterized protein YjlB
VSFYQRKVLIVTYASGRQEHLRCGTATEERERREKLKDMPVTSIKEELQ